MIIIELIFGISLGLIVWRLAVLTEREERRDRVRQRKKKSADRESGADEDVTLLSPDKKTTSIFEYTATERYVSHVLVGVAVVLLVIIVVGVVVLQFFPDVE